MTMAEFVNKGDVINVTLTKDAGYHELIQVGTLAGVTQAAGVTGDTVAVAITGVWLFPAAKALTVGAAAYVLNGSATDTSTGAIKAGTVVAATSTTAEIKLNS
jgi:predicted RecA/RadA family phage recombinase